MHSMSNCHQKNRNATRAIRRIAGLVLAANLFAVLPVAFGRDAARPCERKGVARRDVDAMHAVGIRWVVLTPNVWQERYCSTRQFADFEKSISDFELVDIIDYIHGKGMRVQLRPMLECHDGTGRDGVIVGEDASRVSGRVRGYCRAWFDAMRARSVWYARLAERTKCDMYCLDSEFDRFIDRNDEWKSVVAAVRKVYSGPVTSCHTIHIGPFDWEKVVSDKSHWFYDLDVLSISAYVPARPQGCTNDLSVADMMANLAPLRDKLRRVAKIYGKPMMFGECGCGECAWPFVCPSTRNGGGSPPLLQGAEPAMKEICEKVQLLGKNNNCASGAPRARPSACAATGERPSGLQVRVAWRCGIWYHYHQMMRRLCFESMGRKALVRRGRSRMGAFAHGSNPPPPIN